MTTDPADTLFRDTPHNRLARMAVTPVAAVILAAMLLIAGLGLAIENDNVVKAEKLRQTVVQAQILASSVAAPLAFDDDAAAKDYVNALRANPEVVAAGAYDGTGKLVTGFTRNENSLPATVRIAPPAMSGRDVIVTAQVTQGDTALGSVYLRTSLESWSRRAMRYLGIAIIVVMASLLVAILGASYASLRDAHNKLQAEIASRRQVEEALRHSQKMEAMGQLTGGVAHDFNNLLMAASSGLDLMERTSDPARIEWLKTGIRQALDRGAKLTQQLLTFARRSPLHPEVINLADRIRGMDALLDRSLGEDIMVELRLPARLWPVEVDPSQLEVAVLNIALNARDAMPDGGPIVISAKNVPGQNGAPDMVRLSITDTGSGIASDRFDKIFEPFFTTKAIGRGTGLGLSQVYGFAHGSGGTVEVQSQLGEGTTISLLIPRSMQSPPAQDDTRLTDLPKGKERRQILLVEDDDNVAIMVKEMLSELGYDCERTDTADAALARLRRGADFQLVLSDMVMPGKLSGIDLVRETARQWPGLPTVLMTGYSAAAASASKEGFKLLIKPYSIQDLSAEIEAALGSVR
jgi:signal transduction histidine kinase